jgi:type II secretory pathway component PulF
MIKLKPYSSSLLAVAGFILIATGIYFIFLRPFLLPEDVRYMKTNLSAIQNAAPGLSAWLQKVFWVMGGYIFTSGLLIVFIAFTSFRNHLKGAFSIVTLAGISSIGLMTVANFILDSDFKWILLIFTLPWIMALILYRFHK